MQKALLCVRNLMHCCQEPCGQGQHPPEPCRQELGTRPWEKVHPWARSPPRSRRPQPGSILQALSALALIQGST